MALGSFVHPSGYHHIPYAFGHILELSKMPDTVTNEVVFNQKTIGEAAETVSVDPYYDEYENGYDEYEDGYEGMFPDEVDKALYQTENPNAVMTPWGPALDPVDTEDIMAEYFGAG